MAGHQRNSVALKNMSYVLFNDMETPGTLAFLPLRQLQPLLLKSLQKKDITHPQALKLFLWSPKHDINLPFFCALQFKKSSPEIFDSWTDDSVILYLDEKKRLCEIFRWNFHPFPFYLIRLKWFQCFQRGFLLRRCKFIPSFCILRITCSAKKSTLCFSYTHVILLDLDGAEYSQKIENSDQFESQGKKVNRLHVIPMYRILEYFFFLIVPSLPRKISSFSFLIIVQERSTLKGRDCNFERQMWKSLP